MRHHGRYGFLGLLYLRHAPQSSLDRCCFRTILPTPHVRSFKFVRVFDETSQTAQVSNICDHSFTLPWQPQSSKCQWKIELRLAHVSFVDCFQKHQDEISGATLSVKELFGAFSLAPCAVRAWKSSPCLVVTCRSLSHGDGERTRLAPWWEGGSTAGAHCNPPPLPAGPAGINRNPFKCYMCSRDVCHSASSWESLRFPLLHVSVKSAVASPVQIWCGDRILELSMDTVTWACGACRCSPWYSYLDYLQAPVH